LKTVINFHHVQNSTRNRTQTVSTPDQSLHSIQWNVNVYGRNRTK